MDAYGFDAILDGRPLIGRALPVRLCRQDERVWQHHYLKGGRSAGGGFAFLRETAWWFVRRVMAAPSVKTRAAGTRRVALPKERSEPSSFPEFVSSYS